MPLPVAHSLLAIILYKNIGGKFKNINWLRVSAYIFLANAADLDFIPGFLIGDPSRFHHAISHSFGMAFLLGLVVTLLLRCMKKKNSCYWGMITSVVYSSHALLDFFSKDSGLPYGIPIFWPLSSNYFISPTALFIDVVRGKSNANFLSGLLSIHNGHAIIRELLVMGIIFVIWEGTSFVKKKIWS